MQQNGCRIRVRVLKAGLCTVMYLRLHSANENQGVIGAIGWDNNKEIYGCFRRMKVNPIIPWQTINQERVLKRFGGRRERESSLMMVTMRIFFKVEATKTHRYMECQVGTTFLWKSVWQQQGVHHDEGVSSRAFLRWSAKIGHTHHPIILLFYKQARLMNGRWWWLLLL